MWRDPGPFDVLWCRFPYQGGARHHPWLVLLVGEDGMQPGGVWLVVAGRTLFKNAATREFMQHLNSLSGA